MEDPRRLDLHISMGGRSWPVWVYSAVPEGVRPATRAELLCYGTPVLYQVRIGPDAGNYYTDFVRKTTQPVLLQMLREGTPVYMKK